MALKVSVIVATYCPGEAVRRVVDSLDAQTLPQREFEIVFVDDGSPDDTVERLHGFAADRANVQVHAIPNSGWPSRPRNVGIDFAQAEYVLFMDHDDSLYPDALRRGYEYATETAADVVSVKESRTSDVWWSTSALTDGNIANAYADGGIDRLAEMVPHKLYRRQFLLDRGIQFREGVRVLWEDQLINVAAYRHAKTISVLADTPFYLWHASEQNTTHTFDPARADFWDRLEDLMTHIEETLDTAEFHAAKITMLAHQVRGRVLDRLVRLLAKTDPPTDRGTARMAMKRARELLLRFTSDEVFAALGSKKHQAQAYLLRSNQLDLLREFHELDLASTSHVRVTSAAWESGRLRMEIESRWAPASPDRPLLERVGDGVRLAVPRSLARRIPAELLDVTADVQTERLDLGVRSRTGHVTWALPYRAGAAQVETRNGALALRSHGVCELDTEASAVGAALADSVWDLRCRAEWVGRMRKAAVHYDGPVRPALRDGRPAVAYANMAKGMSVDLAQQARTFAIDAQPRNGPAGPADGFCAPLENVAVSGAGVLAADMVVAVPAGQVTADLGDARRVELVEELAAGGGLAARVVADGGGARFEGCTKLPPGTYALYARRAGTLHRTRRSIAIDQDQQLRFE